MAQGRDLLSLSELCLQNIAENMQSLWLKDYTEKYLEEYHFMYIEGPFNQLSGVMVQELLRILGESHKLNKAGLHLLLQPHLTELSLRPCAGLVSNAITHLITRRCKILTSLDLHSCSRVPAASLVQLIEGLPRLTKLCLADTQSDTNVLLAVGTGCQRLRELDVSHCKKLSATSLPHLVYSTKHGTFQCGGLRVLLMQGMKQHHVPEQWVNALCFLLLAVPSLEQVSNPALSQALKLLRANQFSTITVDGFPSLGEVVRARTLAHKGCNGILCPSGAEPFLQLKKLDDIEEEDLEIVGSLCPQVKEVAISLGSLGGRSGNTVPWNHITHLTLHCPGQALRRLEELIPTLEGVGKELLFLSIQNVVWGEGQSLDSLLRLCPNLRSFHCHLTSSAHPMYNIQLAPWADNLRPIPLPHLHSFSLLLEGGDPISTGFQHTLGGTLVSLFCGSPKLETLSLWGVPVELDMVFETVLSLGPPVPLCSLRGVSLCRSQVTQWGALLLLRSNNHLTSLDLSDCPHVTRRDFHKLQDSARTHKLRLSISWR
ncbi:uncharacterized protein LOC108704853 [Xenopus laevis]|uniref:Uncharacterized protein LOC108704853 n=1 Tax=Xenopus laevis TaxID=8355 RepID=A0A8J1MN36_XENLA|nr:uncharacterized protein LOC108704853 [Xenopus laevis]XP_018097040.1 uncharacterized protein LOC108704853 [Xenopus laevis]XP_041442460.1 uncharacterized protein LOC108704853 [Xenopus laevis]OCT57305.1 hypothetical protein XELAEV_18003682mg [Xenopus laevis]